jgi:hypothetical protein
MTVFLAFATRARPAVALSDTVAPDGGRHDVWMLHQVDVKKITRVEQIFY